MTLQERQLRRLAPVRAVREFEQRNAVLRGRRWLVGVSGGADSSALLLALGLLRPQLEFDLQVAHLNHRLRGADADADALHVERLSQRLGLVFHLGERDVAAEAVQRGQSVELAARQARRDFFASLVEQTGAAGVLLAHTADDQAETLLLHLLRGSGSGGLVGMRALDKQQLADGRCLTLARPMLRVQRTQLVQFLSAAGEDYRDDETNSDYRYRRNWLRGALLPLIEEVYPAARGSLARTAELLADEQALLAELVDGAWREVAGSEEGATSLELTGLLAMPMPLQRLLLRRAYTAQAGSSEGLELAHVEAAQALARGASPSAGVDLPSGLAAWRRYDKLMIGRPPRWPSLPEQPLPIEGEGSYQLPAGWRLEVTAPVSPASVGDDLYCAHFARSGGALAVRRRLPGDRLPLVGGAAGHRKLQDVAVDAKVPRWQRDSLPVVTQAGEPVWLVGVHKGMAVPVADAGGLLRLRFSKRD